MSDTTVLFDLDGTLLSTAADLMASLNHVLVAAEIEPVVYDDMKWLVGQGARVMIERAHVLRERAFTEAAMAEMTTLFFRHYEDAMPGVTAPFPGLLAALDRLEAEGMRLAVCTNKPEGLSRKLLAGLGLVDRFRAIAGGDTFANRKPHRDHVLGTIEKAGGTAARALLVGDSITDVLAARNAGIPVIAVPFGYTDKPVETLGPDRVIVHFDELDGNLVRETIARAKSSSAPAGA